MLRNALNKEHIYCSMIGLEPVLSTGETNVFLNSVKFNSVLLYVYISYKYKSCLCFFFFQEIGENLHTQKNVAKNLHCDPGFKPGPKMDPGIKP